MLGRYLLAGPGVAPEHILGGASENVLPLMVFRLFPAVVIGLYVAAVLAAIMSTIDSLLVIASSAIVRDYYQQLRHPEISDASLTRLSRTATLAMALIALAIAVVVSILSPDRTIFWFVIFGWSGIAAIFCPVMILSLFWKDYTLRGALASMITGFLAIVTFKFVLPALPGIGPYFDAMGEMAPSVLAALIAGVVFGRKQS